MKTSILSQPERDRFRIATLFVAAYVASMASLALFASEARILSFFHDDALFYLRIARNAAAGYGFSFDTRNATNGFHPLWQCLLVLPAYAGALAGFRGLRAILVFHSLLVALGVTAMLRLVSRNGNSKSFEAAVCAFSLLLLGFNEAGMETALYFALLVLLIVAITQRRSGTLLGFLASLVTLARTDAIVVILILAGAVYVFVPVRDERRRALATAAGAFTAYGLLALANVLMFGRATTISASLKQVPFGTLTTHWLQGAVLGVRARLFLVFVWSIVLAFAFAKRVRSRGWRMTGATDVLMVVAAGYGLFYVAALIFAVGGGVGSWHFSIPLLLLAIGTAQVEQSGQSSWRRRWPVKAIALVLILLNVAWVTIQRKAKREDYQSIAGISDWIRTKTEESQVLFQVDCTGWTSYLTGRQIINGDGLVNNFQYQRYVRDGRLRTYLSEQQVSLLVVCNSIDPAASDVQLDIPLWNGKTRRFARVSKKEALYTDPNGMFAAFPTSALDWLP